MPTRRPPAPLATPRRSILWRIITQAAILTTFIIVVFSTVSFIISERLLEESVKTQLSSVASAAQESVEQTLSLARERAALLSNNADIKRVIARKADATTLDHLLVQLQRDEPALSGIEVYNATDGLLAHAGESIGLTPEASRIPSYRTVIGKQGWQWYDVYTPVWDSQANKIGVIALRYDASAFEQPLLRLMPAVDDGARVVFATVQADKIVLLHPSIVSRQSYVVYVKNSDAGTQNMPAVRSAAGQEGVGRFMDDDGRDVLSAYRTVPSLAWGLAVEVDRTAALSAVASLGFSQTMLGVLLILLAASLAYFLASELTLPLRSLARRVRLLRPGNWQTQRSVHTGDEVEMLDTVITDLSLRLRDVYRNQEKEIAHRTEELRKQYARDRVILDEIDQGVITVDRNGLITGINPAALRMINGKKDAVLNTKAVDALDLRGHRGAELTTEHPVLHCLRTRRLFRAPATAHWSVMRKDGTMLPVLFAISPLMEGKTFFGAIVVLQDFTEERRLDYLKSEFITLASHQLRTPLSAARWYVELMQEEKRSLTDDQRMYLREIDHGLVRMVDLLTALLHAAHLEGEGLKPDIQTIDISALVRDMQKDCETMANESGVSCKLSGPQRKLMMKTDPTLLRIVLQNLISNAVKYSQKGKRITIHYSPTASRVTFAVEDQGVGIPASEQSRVFQRFFRARNVRQLDTDGNGLGLYITKSIVERLGGTIDFKSKENEGTTFTVSFPLKEKKTK